MSEVRLLALSIAIPAALVAIAIAVSTLLDDGAGQGAPEANRGVAQSAPAPRAERIPTPTRAAPTATATPGADSRCPEDGEVASHLLEAAACGDTAELTRLLRDGAQPDPTDTRSRFAGFTALHHAVARGDRQAIQLLLDTGARADAPDRHGNSPLHLLTLGDRIVGDAEIARTLVHAGADVLRANRAGKTPLQTLQAHPRLARASPALTRYLAETTEQVSLLASTRSYLNRESAPPNAFAALNIDTPPVQGVFDLPEQGAPPDTQVRETILSWASAWSRGDVGAYLAHYAADFQPPEGGTRADWAQSRRARIEAAEHIVVTADGLAIRVDGDRAEASFTQTYRARGVRDVSRKQMALVRRAGAWRIVSEVERRR
ncbi:MAG: ankyrin repeat domain-containing protein [Rhodocyclaceae bacterium]|nr:ankyrin repeat domain-containing protein [Rhodocyclaceae bacterium]